MVFSNPATIHKPLSTYSHQVEVSGSAKWLVMSGQVGMDKNGNIPENVIEQLEIALDNIISNLEAAGMSRENLVKLTFYFVGPLDTAQRRGAVSAKMGGHEPCMTTMYVSGLANDAYKVEVDALACSEG